MFAIFVLMSGVDVGFAFPRRGFVTYLLATVIAIIRCEYLCGFSNSVDRSYVLWGCLFAKGHPIMNAKTRVS